MTQRSALDDFDLAAEGERLYGFIERAYPIARSITGDGVRATLELLSTSLLSTEAARSLVVHEVPSGTSVLDWQVPLEWNVQAAWIKDPQGRKVVDLADHSLHLLGYSTPVRRRLGREELDEHLYSLPEQPTLIPYRTSYYAERWGFCLPHEQRLRLEEGEYEVMIDSTLEPGALTYGELLVPGSSEREVLLSTHICHPSLCNDNLSGVAVMAALASLLAGQRGLRYGYRFLFVPGTIGAITWLARNRETVTNVAHGLVAANLGDSGGFHYKRSRHGDREVDRAVVRALRSLGEQVEIEAFVPFGYDERQYSSPGFDLPVGSLTRTPWGRYPQYHTSADDLDFVQPQALAGSARAYLEVVSELESTPTYLSQAPYGEPQLGRRGLYRTLGGDDRGRERELAMLWVLNQSDGRHSLVDIADRSGLDLADIEAAAAALLEQDLLREV